MSALRVLVCNAGTLRVFRIAQELRDRGLLRRCVTSLYFPPRAFAWLPVPLRARLERLAANRRCAQLEGAVRTLPLPELLHLAAARLGIGSPARWIGWRNRTFCRWVARRGLEDVDLVWSFDTSSLEIFEAARARGIPCVLDVSIAHPASANRIFAEHSALGPEYAADLVDRVAEAQVARRRREMELADRIVAGSSFVAATLLEEGVPREKVTVNPYGVDLDAFRPGESRPDSRRPLAFLFVGWFSQRKGVYYLLEAWERCGLGKAGATLRLAGGDRDDLPYWPGPLPQGVELLGRVPHAELPEEFRRADAFVFPSIFEGFAKVILEAMASGLPVITTPNACDAAAVVHEENGLLCPPGDVAALAASMLHLSQDSEARGRMGRRSLEMAARYSWRAYGDRCREVCLAAAAPRPRVLANNAGTLHVFRLAQELDRHGLLQACTTSLYFAPRAFAFLPRGLRRKVESLAANRSCATLQGRVRTWPLPELVHLAARRAGVGESPALILWRNRRFSRWVAAHCLERVEVVWSFDTSSLELFEAAKARGLRCILEVSIAHPALGNRILTEDARRRPQYAQDLGALVSEANLARRAREMELADRLVAGSSFAADSLRAEGLPEEKIRINPYGVDFEQFARGAGLERSAEGGVVFLFVGSFSQRKGIYYLLEAWQRGRFWESGAVLRLVGGDRHELRYWAGELPPGIEVLGRLPHARLPRVFGAADVFVFPSLFEGFAKVILEAMAAGLPIITTPNACDAAAVVHGDNGFLAPPGDVDALVEEMQRLAGDAALRTAMGASSRRHAQSYSWAAYGERCRDIALELAAEHE